MCIITEPQVAAAALATSAREELSVFTIVWRPRAKGVRERAEEREGGRERKKKPGFLSIVARFRLPEGSTQSVVQFWCKTVCLAV